MAWIRVDGRAVESPLADHHELAFPRIAIGPRPVEARAEAMADALHLKPHGLAGDGNEALDAQHVMRLGYGLETRQQALRIADLRERHDEAFEIVVVMRANTHSAGDCGGSAYTLRSPGGTCSFG